jgi:hypothetical protein
MAHIETEPTAAPEHVTDASTRRSPATSLPRIVTIAAGSAALLWTVAAVLCSSRGLDITDESFYLLSYRWWDVNFDTFTGAQYFYGPVFELLGHDIAELRVFKVVTLLSAHAFFGWEFMRWLRLHRPGAASTRWWEAAGTAAVVACAGIVYSWLPLSPGYNDLALTCTVLAAALLMRVAIELTQRATGSAWPPLALGAVAVVMLLDKWSSSLVTLMVVGAALVILVATTRSGWRRLGHLAGFATIGALLALGVIDAFLVPLHTLVPPLVEVNSLVAESSNSPRILLTTYWTGASGLGRAILHQQVVLLVASVAICFVRTRWIGVGVAVAALGTAAIQIVRHHGLMAGPMNLQNFTVTVFTPLVAVALAGATHAALSALRRGDLRGSFTSAGVGRATVFLMLVALPIAQAAGTGNPVHYLAMTGLGLWMAASIMVLTGFDVSAHAPRTLVAGTLAVLVVATSAIAFDGLWNRPYRTTGHDASNTAAADVPALSSVHLDRTTARTYADLHALLRQYVEPAGRAMMGFDGLAGVVLMLDGRPVGEAWYSGSIPSRSAAGIRRACENGHPWWGDREPLVFFNRPETRRERVVLRGCGLSLRDDYRLLTFAGVRGGTLHVYVPIDEPTEK